jgi:hypothetical protein
MLTGLYIASVVLAGFLAAVHCLLPALIVAGVAALIVFRKEIARWARDLHTAPIV